jgi:hydrogenase nickel incorporation protein HypB
VAEIPVGQRVLASNNAVAARQLEELTRVGVFSINLMSSPGSGKTSLVERTIEALGGRLRIHVIEGDLQGDLDARRVIARGASCTQVNTEGGCHLDAMMLQAVLPSVALGELDLLLIENVGNLVCPAEFTMPAHRNVTLLSTPEGSDKPAKYPIMFAKSDLVVVTKTDLLPHVDFDATAVRRALAALRPRMPVFELSMKTGAGLHEWLDWVEAGVAALRASISLPNADAILK